MSHGQQNWHRAVLWAGPAGKACWVLGRRLALGGPSTPPARTQALRVPRRTPEKTHVSTGMGVHTTQ